MHAAIPYSIPFEEFGGLVGEILHKAFYAWRGTTGLKLFQALIDYSFVAIMDGLRRRDQVICQVDRVGDSFH